MKIRLQSKFDHQAKDSQQNADQRGFSFQAQDLLGPRRISTVEPHMLPTLPKASEYPGSLGSSPKKMKQQSKSKQRLSKTTKFGKLNAGLSAKSYALDIKQ